MATSKPDDRRRPERVATRVREELAAALTRDLSDPRLLGVVVSRVEVTDDLSTARVRLAVIGDTAALPRATAAARVLQRLEGALRSRLAPRLGMRRVPTLVFEVDRAREESDRLDALLAEVRAEITTPKKNPGEE